MGFVGAEAEGGDRGRSGEEKRGGRGRIGSVGDWD